MALTPFDNLTAHWLPRRFAIVVASNALSPAVQKAALLNAIDAKRHGSLSHGGARAILAISYTGFVSVCANFSNLVVATFRSLSRGQQSNGGIR